MKVKQLIEELQKLPQDVECKSFEFQFDDFMEIVAVEYGAKEVEPYVRLMTQMDIDV